MSAVYSTFGTIVGSLTGVAFGTMLGWSSVVFPLLVNPDISPILISWDSTPLVASFLMYGNMLGVAFSSIKLCGSKLGVLIGCGCQIAGWIVMYFAHDMIGLGFARVLVGFGNGFALGQIRTYVEEILKPNLQKFYLQYMPLSLNVGLILVFLVGPYVTFRSLSIVCFFIPTIALIVFAFIPKINYPPSTERSIATIPDTNDLKNPSREKLMTQEQLGFIDAFKNKEIRRCLLLSLCLIFVPPFTGGAPNIVYSHTVYIATLNPYPNICSIIYATVFLLTTFFALKYTCAFPRKPIIVASCIICSLLLGLVSLYFYFLNDLLQISTHFVWIPLVVLIIFNFFHTVGINIIPILLISDIYPKNAKVIGIKFYHILFSLLSVLSIKVSQLLFTNFGFHITYACLSTVGLVSAIIIGCFTKEPSDKTFRLKLPKIVDSQKRDSIMNTGKFTPHLHGYVNNNVDLNDERVLH